MKWNQGEGTDWSKLSGKKIVALLYGNEHVGRQVKVGFIKAYGISCKYIISCGFHNEHFVNGIEFWLTEEEFLNSIEL